MTATSFDQVTALSIYTEAMRRIQVGAYEERDSEQYEQGTYPADGVEQSIDQLTVRAAQAGLYFVWDDDQQVYTLEPMTEEREQDYYEKRTYGIYDTRVFPECFGREGQWFAMVYLIGTRNAIWETLRFATVEEAQSAAIEWIENREIEWIEQRKGK